MEKTAMAELWAQQIPTTRDKDGNLWYDCDVFFIPRDDQDSASTSDHKKAFFEIRELRITGNLCLGDGFKLKDVFLRGSGFFGDYTRLWNLVSDGSNEFGDYADTCDVTAGTYNLFGDFADICDVTAGTFNLFGNHANTLEVKVFSYQDTFFGKDAKIYDVEALGGLYFDGPSTYEYSGVVTAMEGIHIEFPDTN